MQAGIYNNKAPSIKPTRTIRIGDLAPDASTQVELGTLDFEQDSERLCIRASPLKNPDTVHVIYVDRSFLARGSKRQK